MAPDRLANSLAGSHPAQSASEPRAKDRRTLLSGRGLRSCTHCILVFLPSGRVLDTIRYETFSQENMSSQRATRTATRTIVAFIRIVSAFPTEKKRTALVSYKRLTDYDSVDEYAATGKTDRCADCGYDRAEFCGASGRFNNKNVTNKIVTSPPRRIHILSHGIEFAVFVSPVLRLVHW